MYLLSLIVLVVALAAATEALLCDGRFEGCALAITVQLPFWRGQPTTMALSGGTGDVAASRPGGGTPLRRRP